jgi:hypothetical protein
VGILYLDESGNTGLKDTNQKLLIYGGPFIDIKSWRIVNKELEKVRNKYFSIIAGRVQPTEFLGDYTSAEFINRITGSIEFLKKFQFHSKNIVDRKGLWSKLNNCERFEVLHDILDILVKNDIIFYIGSLNKKIYLDNPKFSKGKMDEYCFLHNSFMQFIEGELESNEQVVTIIDDGDDSEKRILKKCLNDSSRTKFFGELICGKACDYPPLQFADVGNWIFQSFHRITDDRNDNYANEVRRLYNQLTGIMHLHNCLDEQ